MDIVGKTLRGVEILSRLDELTDGKRLWVLGKCSCGNIRKFPARGLTSGTRIVTCGDHTRHKYKRKTFNADLIGMEIGLITIIGFEGYNVNGMVLVNGRCRCGNHKVYNLNYITQRSHHRVCHCIELKIGKWSTVKSGYKRCRRCKIERPLSNFELNKINCYSCSRDPHLMATYGITFTDKTKLMELQIGRCAICLEEFKEYKLAGVDHNHTTGEIRGLLCVSCNTGLGSFKDNPESLKWAREYVMKSGIFSDLGMSADSILGFHKVK